MVRIKNVGCPRLRDFPNILVKGYRIVIEIVRVVKLSRIHEDADKRNIVLRNRSFNKGNVALVDRPHSGYETYCFSLFPEFRDFLTPPGNCRNYFRLFHDTQFRNHFRNMILSRWENFPLQHHRETGLRPRTPAPRHPCIA